MKLRIAKKLLSRSGIELTPVYSERGIHLEAPSWALADPRLAAALRRLNRHLFSHPAYRPAPTPNQ